MNITASAVSLTVADPEQSARFLEQTFDFERELAGDGFVSLTRPDAGFNVIYLRANLPTFKPRDRADRTADGILIVLVVDDIDAEYERLTAAGTAILTPIQTEEWGERYFQVEDPNGVIVQLVRWVAAPTDTVTVKPADHHSEYLAKAVAALTPEGRRRADELLDQLALAGRSREWVVRFAMARETEVDTGHTDASAAEEPGGLFSEEELDVLTRGFRTIRDQEPLDDVADWANAVLALLADERARA